MLCGVLAISFLAVNDVANVFFQTFGSGVLLAGSIILLIVGMLFVLRANLGVILVIIIPLLAGFVLNATTNNFIEIPQYVFIVSLFAIALVFAVVVWINLFK